MIAGVNGVLAAAGDDWVQVTVGGVTFQVLVPPSEILTLGPVGGQVQLYTHLRIRDEHPILYGFTSQAALDLFLATQGVSGVGPRLGLALLSGLGAAGLQQAIALGDSAKLSGVSGVGRRTADRIIVDLQGKMDSVEVDAGEAGAHSADSDLIDALSSMGYTTTEVRRVLANLERSPDMTVEDYLRQALQLIGGW
ncbi:MAG: Holliday junction branch migration protein RuvA [Chloroflexota bacterium]|nr:Holliday junction branch migration protein RuvA [Chloroflexota bacterium]